MVTRHADFVVAIFYSPLSGKHPFDLPAPKR